MKALLFVALGCVTQTQLNDVSAVEQAEDASNLVPGATSRVTRSGTKDCDLAVGYELLFDGTSYVSTPIRMTERKPFTVEAWVTPFHWIPKNLASVISNAEGSGMSLEISREGKWQFAVHDRGEYKMGISSDVPEMKRRVHVAGVFDGRSVKLYVDGSLMENHSMVAAPLRLSRFRFLIGANPSGKEKAGDFFHGRIDELRLSSVARYSEEFRPQEKFMPAKDTTALCHFDEGKGRTLIDASGNGHHGDIHEATWVRTGGDE